MLVRIRRETVASEPSPSANEGSSVWLNLPQP